MLEQVEIGEQVKSVSPEALDSVYSLQTSVRTRPYSLEGTCKCQKKAHIEVGAPYPHQLSSPPFTADLWPKNLPNPFFSHAYSTCRTATLSGKRTKKRTHYFSLFIKNIRKPTLASHLKQFCIAWLLVSQPEPQTSERLCSLEVIWYRPLMLL